MKNKKTVLLSNAKIEQKIDQKTDKIISLSSQNLMSFFFHFV